MVTGSLMAVLRKGQGQGQGHAISRVVGLALVLLPLLLVTVACLPALAVLPFVEGGEARARRLVRLLMAWSTRLPPAQGGA